LEDLFFGCVHHLGRMRYSRRFKQEVDILAHPSDYKIEVRVIARNNFGMIQEYRCKKCNAILMRQFTSFAVYPEEYGVRVSRINPTNGSLVLLIGNKELVVKPNTQEWKVAELFMDMCREKLGKKNIRNRLWKVVSIP
jgi:hypothetical protein